MNPPRTGTTFVFEKWIATLSGSSTNVSIDQRRSASVFFIRDDAATRINLSRCNAVVIKHCGEQRARKSFAK